MRKAINKSDWKGGFLFLGNELVLDFLNTRPVMNGQASELLPDFGALLLWFQAADLLNSQEVSRLQTRWGGTARTRQAMETMWGLREKLRNEILAWEHSGAINRSMIDQLNRIMAEHPMLKRLTAKRSVHTAELWFTAEEPEDLLAPLAHSAATLFANVNHNRVRKCDQCVLHFHDTSKKGTRRWCSMQLCGNRLKVAAYAARQHKRAHRMAP